MILVALFNVFIIIPDLTFELLEPLNLLVKAEVDKL